jgi:dihydrodipicolinate synthase/N-acetylneuraminate lyase
MAGGDLANVNRWRGQVNLGPIDEDTLAKTAEHVKANGHDYLLVDLAGDAPMGDKREKERILAAILDESDRSWFIKMVGEEAAVESQKAAFISFLQSLKLP